MIVFPPSIVATSERPDIVIWSKLARVVIMIELTVCAEEGIAAAQARKESRYQSLLDEITALKSWRPWLLTIEIGARGLVASRSYHAFKKLGLTSRDTKKLCKALSTVAARCSYAVFLAHKEYAWYKHDLVLLPTSKPKPDLSDCPNKKPSEPNIKVMQRHGIQQLFHFTDAANLDSIRVHGLLSASSLASNSIDSVMNSDELSRTLDKARGLEDYVRLSFNDKNPMQFKALQEKRVSKLVMLRVKMQVVSRPGVLFSDCNATRNDVVKSANPDVVRFDIVKAKSQFEVKQDLRHYYQAEVLVPSPIPPHLIEFPVPAADQKPARTRSVATLARARAASKEKLTYTAADVALARARAPIEFSATASDQKLARAASDAIPAARPCEPVSNEPDACFPLWTIALVAFSMMPLFLLMILTAYPRVRHRSRGRGLKEARYLHALKLSRCFRTFVSSQSRSPLSNRALTLPHTPLISVGCQIPAHAPALPRENPLISVGCQMPLKDTKKGCEECLNLGPFQNCTRAGHMPLCNADDIWIACHHCSRILCSQHSEDCYCLSRLREPQFKEYRLTFVELHAPSNSKKAPGSTMEAVDA